MADRCALITGITGQDGSYLAEFLLARGYEVHGIIRRSSSFNTGRIDHLYTDPHQRGRRLHLHHGDVTDSARLIDLIAGIRPDEIYHLAAQSHVRVSFDEPVHTADVISLGTARILEAIRSARLDTRFYHASSSEMFGQTAPPQSVHTPFEPRSPYAAAKLHAHWLTRSYREGHGMHAVNGVLFNHESPRRGETFVTRKISMAAARISRGLQDSLHLGNLDAVRDWGYAPEYVAGMWAMLQADEPRDHVLATGTGATVRDFLDAAFGHLGLDWHSHVQFDERYLRPAEVDALVGDPGEAAAGLDWKATVGHLELAVLMVDADLALLDGGGIDTVALPGWYG